MAALGVRFYNGTAFPAAYRGGRLALIAEHGSWNRSPKIGYRVAFVLLDAEGRAVRHGIFACGWLYRRRTPALGERYIEKLSSYEAVRRRMISGRFRRRGRGPTKSLLRHHDLQKLDCRLLMYDRMTY